MKTLAKFLIFASIAITSCNENEIDYLTLKDENLKSLDDAKEASSAIKGVEAVIRRGKLKQRSNGLYRMVMFVPSDLANQVVETSLEVLTDVDATLESSSVSEDPKQVFEPQTFILERKGRTKDGAFVRYVNNQIKFKADPSGRIFRTKAILRGEKGEPIGEVMTSYVTAIGLNSILDRNPKLKTNVRRLRSNPSTRTAARRIKKQMISTLQTYAGVSENDISDEEVAAYASELQLTMSLKPVDWGSSTEEETFPLGFAEIRRGLVRFNNSSINFVEPDNVKGRAYIATISIKSTDGEELDYAEFRITGQE